MSASWRNTCSFKFTSIKDTIYKTQKILAYSSLPCSTERIQKKREKKKPKREKKQTKQKSRINITVEIIPFNLFSREGTGSRKTQPFAILLHSGQFFLFSEAQSHKHHGPAQRRWGFFPLQSSAQPEGQSLPFIASFTPIPHARTTPNLYWKLLETVHPDADLINSADSSKCRNSESFTTNLFCSFLRWCTTVQISGHKAYTRSLGFWSKELTVKWTELRCVRAPQT